MIKTKVKIVGDLITTCLFDRTLSCRQVFEIFDPYVEFAPGATAASIGAFAYDKDSHNSFKMTENLISTNCTELGLIKFKVHKKFHKTIRIFNIDSKVRYCVWLSNSWKANTNEHIRSKLIFRQGVMLTCMPDGPGMYHFLREMKKLVPTCISDLEKLMFMNL